MIARILVLSTALLLMPAFVAGKPPAARTRLGSVDAPANSAKPATIEVPAGTKIPLVLENAISTRTAHAGDPVYFQTLYPIIVQSHMVIPAGSYMGGQVLSAKRPGRIRGRGQLVLKLTQLILPNGYTVSLDGVPSDVGSGGGEKMGKEGQIEGPTSRATDAGIIIRSTLLWCGDRRSRRGRHGRKKQDWESEPQPGCSACC